MYCFYLKRFAGCYAAAFSKKEKKPGASRATAGANRRSSDE